MNNNALYFTEVTCMIDAVPRSRVGKVDGDKIVGDVFDLYPVSVFRRERDIFNRDRLRRYKTLMAHPASDEVVLKPGRVVSGRITEVSQFRNEKPISSIRDLSESSYFRLNELKAGSFDALFSKTMPGPAELPLKARVTQAIERAFRRNGDWMGRPTGRWVTPEPVAASVVTLRTPSP